MVGYSLQGFAKFGFYEIFKDVYKAAVGKENAAKYQTIGFAISSASAEVIADVLLCPWEAVSIESYKQCVFKILITIYLIKMFNTTG